MGKTRLVGVPHRCDEDYADVKRILKKRTQRVASPTLCPMGHGERRFNCTGLRCCRLQPSNILSNYAVATSSIQQKPVLIVYLRRSVQAYCHMKLEVVHYLVELVW